MHRLKQTTGIKTPFLSSFSPPLMGCEPAQGLDADRRAKPLKFQ
jgi:hypothetical protein